MKKVLILICVFASLQSFSQTDSELGLPKYVYCEMLGYAKFLSTKVTVEIDFGEKRKFFADKRMNDPATGKSGYSILW